MPAPGHFKLHARAQPPLEAGDYRLTGDQSITGGVAEQLVSHLRVTSPRYALPPEQILSTWPAANDEGAFEARLPQIVLRRRTLPWERLADPSDRSVPWLALVVVAEGEGSISEQSPVADCVTPGVVLGGPNDVPSGVYLSVTETVVRAVFPTVEDLRLLTHVREVDIGDTELAMGDDDGFLAVVLANRLPQFDRVACAPVRYLACLINLEGQLDELPPPTPEPVFEFEVVGAVQDFRVAYAEYSAQPDHQVMGTGQLVRAADLDVLSGAGPGAGDARAARDPSVRAAAQEFRAPPAEPVDTRAAQATWRAAPDMIERAAIGASGSEVGRVVRDAMRTGFHLPIEHLTVERTLRFPVLAHWSFTCTGAGSFESLMRGLDVGLLGTVPADAAARPRADCAPEPAGDAPPGAPGARPAPELAETGHVGLAHQTRRGDATRAWYRGPLGPHVIERPEPDADGRLLLAHVSDQLRRAIPDGREDLAYAAAFEIGRLLALSQPSVVAALMRWRAEQFGADRAARIARLGAGGAIADLGDVAGTALGGLLGRSLVLTLAKDPLAMLAPSRPLVDPGRPLDHLEGGLAEVVGRGLGIDPQIVTAALDPAAGAVLADVPVPVVRMGADLDEAAVASLHRRLDAEVEALAVGSDVPRPPPPGTATPAAAPDPIGALAAAAARRRAKEVDP
jgi:hypothetical protein